MKRMMLACMLAIFLALPVAAQEGPYRTFKGIPIPGAGTFDGPSIDSAAHRLFVSPGNRIVAVHAERDAIGGEITDVSRVHGLTHGFDQTRGFSANGGEETVSIVDPATHRIHLAVPDFEAPAPGQTGGPKAIPGTFRVLVYEMRAEMSPETRNRQQIGVTRVRP